MNATALYTADKCEVWCGTQNGEAAFAATLEASGLPADKCDVYKHDARRRLRPPRPDRLCPRRRWPSPSRCRARPVKLLWSREEDMQHGTYHPITHCKMVGALDADNNLTALQMRISGQSIQFACVRRPWSTAWIPATFSGLNAERRSRDRIFDSRIS